MVFRVCRRSVSFGGFFLNTTHNHASTETNRISQDNFASPQPEALHVDRIGHAHGQRPLFCGTLFDSPNRVRQPWLCESGWAIDLLLHTREMKPYGSKKCYALEDSMTRKSLEAQFFNLRINDKQRRTLKRRARALAKKQIQNEINASNYEA